jgi:Ca-activated chloride channel family protein
MTEFAAFQFLQPGWLLLLPALWLLIRIYSRHSRRPSMWSRICDPELLHKMLVEKPGRDGNQWLIGIIIIVLTLGVLALAGPSWRQQSHPVMESISARVVALDLSRSMLVEDVSPKRFTQAVAAAREIISSDFDGETGLVVFAGAAFVVSPLSRDATTLLAFLNALDPSTMPEDGTRIDLAIDVAAELLAASVAGNGQIFIVTAGDTDSQEAVQAALNAANLGHSVSVLAIGTAAGGPLLNKQGGLTRDPEGKILLSRSNFALLERVAQAGRGSIIALTGSRVYGDLLLARLGANQLVESERATDRSNRVAANDGVWIVWLMLPFALLLFRKNLVWMILLSVLLPFDGDLYAREWDSFWTHPEWLAFEAYRQGDYQSSYELSSSPALQAAAYYRSGEYQRALELYAEDDSAQAAYNRGNAFAQQQLFAEALLAYQQALLQNPEFAPARYNKRLLELYLEQQAEIDNGLTNDSTDGEAADETFEQPGTEARIGINDQYQTNPADDLQLGPGLGASMQSAQVDPFESFDGLEQQLERFVLRAQGADQLPDPEFIERWIKTLPETSTDLYRRKFLRDYQRQKRQPR